MLRTVASVLRRGALRMNQSIAGNVVPFRRGAQTRGWTPAAGQRDQRGFMDAVYAVGSLPVAAEDRDTKLMASRLQVYGFVVVDEVSADGSLRRLRPSEAIRVSRERPWRVSKASLEASRAVTIPAADRFLFEGPIPA
jgi:hypothetical protein